jgi:hypothetical protein
MEDGSTALFLLNNSYTLKILIKASCFSSTFRQQATFNEGLGEMSSSTLRAGHAHLLQVSLVSRVVKLETFLCKVTLESKWLWHGYNRCSKVTSYWKN